MPNEAPRQSTSQRRPMPPRVPYPPPDPNYDPFGTTGLICGIVAACCAAMGFFTCGMTWFPAPIFAMIGFAAGFHGKGNRRVAAMVISAVVLVPTLLLFFMMVTGRLARR